MEKMNGRQLAGWGYGVFWSGLLIETVDCFLSAQSTAPLGSPVFWIGQFVTLSCLAIALRMLLMIPTRPWSSSAP